MGVGQFDGVHLGHQKIFNSLVEMSKLNNCKAAIWTFARTLPKGNFKKIAHPNVQNHWCSHFGIEEIHCLDFTPEISSWKAHDFLNEILIEKLNAKGIVLGENSRLGRGRECSASEFLDLAQAKGLSTELIELNALDNLTISSTIIREAISDGELEKVAQFLGHPYWMGGEVIPGQQNGRKIGFPTANILLDGYTHPPYGVYSCIIDIESLGKKWLKGIAYIGERPSVDKQNQEVRLEVHIPGFSGDLYGKIVFVELEEKIRGEQKFDSLDELKKQIQKDLTYLYK